MSIVITLVSMIIISSISSPIWSRMYHHHQQQQQQQQRQQLFNSSLDLSHTDDGHTSLSGKY
jgi:hypothetical protein